MPLNVSLRGIAEELRLYVVDRQTRVPGFQGRFMLVFEPSQIWWEALPVVVDAFPTRGSAMGRVRKIYKLFTIAQVGAWDGKPGEDAGRIGARRVEVIKNLNHTAAQDEERRKKKKK